MKTPKVKFSYNYSKGSALNKTLKSRALSENFFYGLLKLYNGRKTVPLREIERCCKTMMPEAVYFEIGKLPYDEWDEQGACLSSYLKDNGQILRYKLQVQAEENCLNIEGLPSLIHETTHLFDTLLMPKTLKTLEKLTNSNNDERIYSLFSRYYYNGNEDNMAKNTSLWNIKMQTNKVIKNMNIKDKLIALNYIKETMQTEFNAMKMESMCSEYLKDMGKDTDSYTFEEMDKLYQYEKKIDLINKMINKILLDERYKMAMNQSNSPMDKLKLTVSYCLKSLI